jgi:hypothetical protein
MGELLRLAAMTLPIWRDGAMAALACVVIGALYLYASLVGEP